MFVKVKKEGKEVLVNVDSISKIELQYFEHDRSGKLVKLGVGNSLATKVFTIFVGSDAFALDPNSPAVAIVEKIYNDSIQG